MSDSSAVDPIVRSLFQVKDSFARDEGSEEYSVVYDAAGSRDAFKTLCHRLAPLGYTPHLSGSPEDTTLIVTKKEPEQSKATARTPVFLMLLSVVAIIATGWGVGVIYAQEAGTNVVLAGVSFSAGLIAVLVVRDLAHRVAARHSGVSSLQYYLPNIPLFVPLPVLYYLPTFGSITFLRSPTIDRDALFDFYFVGAVAGVLAALAIAFAGASSAVVFAPTQPGALSSNPSLLQTFALAVGGNSLSVVAPSGDVALFSPLEIAAWVGFLISFFSLVPAALFDGGRMSTLVLGERGSKITTMVTAMLLLVIDIPNYWVLFLLIFLLAAVQPSSETLDSVTKLSRSRRLMFLVVVLLVFLCIPIPQTFLTLHL